MVDCQRSQVRNESGQNCPNTGNRDMANKLIDPKMYKHIKSDDKSTTLQHKHGHVLTIAHNILNPDMKAQLQALSKAPEQDETATQREEASAPYGKVSRQGYSKGGQPVPQESPSNFTNMPPTCYDDGGLIDTVKKAIAPVFATQDTNTVSDLRDATVYNHKMYQPPPANKAEGGRVNMAEGGEAGLPCLNPSC